MKYASIPDCKIVSEASCSIARNIMNKLCEELTSDGRLFDGKITLSHSFGHTFARNVEKSAIGGNQFDDLL